MQSFGRFKRSKVLASKCGRPSPEISCQVPCHDASVCSKLAKYLGTADLKENKDSETQKAESGERG